MATTLVGIFDSISEAERARQMLVREGLDVTTVHVTDHQSLSRGSSDDNVETEDRRGFFSRLFGIGDGDDTVDTYSDALKHGSAMVTVTLDDNSDTQRVTSLLESAGAVDVDERARQSRSGMKSERLESGAMRTEATARNANLGNDTLKVVQEELQVGKRSVETGGVRVRQFVTERPVHEQVQLCQERAIVERRPVDRVLGANELGSLDLGDREFEVRERHEEAVVAKQARVVEEVAVGKTAEVRTETIDETVRRQDVDVEQLTAQTQRQQGDSAKNRNPPV